MGHICRVIIFTLICFSDLIAVSAHGQLNTVQIYKRLSPSVLTVVCYNEQGVTQGQGTAFGVDSGLILINRHTLEGAAQAQCRDFKRNKYQLVSVVAENDSVDLLLVKVAGGRVFAPPVKIATTPAEPGEPIAFVGIPKGWNSVCTRESSPQCELSRVREQCSSFRQKLLRVPAAVPS